MKSLLVPALILLSLPAMASKLTDQALKYVPGAEVLEEKGDEVKLKTASGTVVEVEFDRSGKLDEASGKSVEKDVFVPGDSLISLADASKALTKEGKKPVGEWSLDDSLVRGWHFEFEGYENGKKFEYLVDAKSGKLLKSKADD